MGLRVNNKEVPDRLSRCSTETFQRIAVEWEPDKPIEDRDRVKLYSILCDEPYQAIADIQDQTLTDALWEASRFIYEEELDLTKLPVPKDIMFHSKCIAIPRNLGKMTIGQNIHLRQAIATGAEPVSLISKAVAIFLQPFVDGPVIGGVERKGLTNYERAMEYEKDIRLLPITVTYPIGFFFLSKVRPFGIESLQNFLRKILMRLLGVRLSPSSQVRINWTGILRFHF